MSPVSTACVAASVVALSGAAWGGTLSIDSRMGGASFLASDFSGVVMDDWTTPPGAGSFFIDEGVGTPSMLTGSFASMAFTYMPGASITGGAALDGFTLTGGGHVEGLLLFDAFFTVTSSFDYSWSTVVFDADPGTSAVIELTGPGGLVSTGAGTFDPGVYHLAITLSMVTDPPPGPAGFSTHVLFELIIPAPGSALLLGAMSLAGSRRRRRAPAGRQ